MTLLALFLFLSTAAPAAEVTVTTWEVKKSAHFVVYFQQAPDGYVDELIRKAEEYYNDIVTELGFTRYDSFWTWDNRCKIYLYPSLEEYQKATGRPEWSGGAADVVQRKIETLSTDRDFLNTILPHEMGHLIFREFIGNKTPLPLWLDEGIACLQEKTTNRDMRIQIAKVAVNSTSFIPLAQLTQLTSQQLTAPDIFYAEAVSVIDFLQKKYGKDKFIDFCRKLRDTKNWPMSLNTVYGFDTLSQMNAEWMGFLRQ